SFVVARDAASVYKGKPRDAGKVGRELGVRYAVEGSMNLTGEAVAVNAELFSTETGTPIWTDRIEGERSQLGKLQDDPVARLANTLGAEPVKPASPLMLRERYGFARERRGPTGQPTGHSAAAASSGFPSAVSGSADRAAPRLLRNARRVPKKRRDLSPAFGGLA
ncbi:MAG TPA: hypothetical protein VF886_16365, partial [Roseiarcus sp.]